MWNVEKPMITRTKINIRYFYLQHILYIVFWHKNLVTTKNPIRLKIWNEKISIILYGCVFYQENCYEEIY
jgi:hypothetical protein